MNKKQFVGAIAADTGLPQATVARVLDSARNLSHSIVSQGGEVKLKGWMTISRVELSDRVGRNPQTGQPMTLPARFRTKFKAHEGYGV